MAVMAATHAGDIHQHAGRLCASENCSKIEPSANKQQPASPVPRNQNRPNPCAKRLDLGSRVGSKENR